MKRKRTQAYEKKTPELTEHKECCIMIQYDGRRGKSASVIPAPIKGGAFGKSQAGAEEFSVVCWITEAPDTETEGRHPERKKAKKRAGRRSLVCFFMSRT